MATAAVDPTPSSFSSSSSSPLPYWLTRFSSDGESPGSTPSTSSSAVTAADKVATMASLSNAELLQRTLQLFDEHKVMVAGRYLQALEARGLVRPLHSVAAQKLEDLRRVYRRVTDLRASLAGSSSWEVQRDANGIRCLYQAHESGFVRIRLDAEVEAPCFDIIALLREVELWRLWVPSFAGLGLTGARQLGQTSILNMCFHCVVHLPWPLQNRSCTFAVDGVDCMSAEDAPQQVVVLLDSGCAQANCPESIAPWRDEHTPAEIMDSGVIITPAEVAGTKHTFVQVIVTVDPKMSVPRWLVNAAVRNLCFLLMVQIRKAVAVTRKEAHLAVLTDPDNTFYAFIRRRMAESLPSQLALAPPLRAKLPLPSRTGPPSLMAKEDLFCCGFRKLLTTREPSRSQDRPRCNASLTQGTSMQRCGRGAEAMPPAASVASVSADPAQAQHQRHIRKGGNPRRSWAAWMAGQQLAWLLPGLALLLAVAAHLLPPLSNCLAVVWRASRLLEDAAGFVAHQFTNCLAWAI